jgi:hypothetical protein
MQNQVSSLKYVTFGIKIANATRLLIAKKGNSTAALPKAAYLMRHQSISAIEGIGLFIMDLDSTISSAFFI